MNVLLVICLLFNAQYSHSNDINVAVAANFKQTLQALKIPFENSTHHSIKIISASTGQLVQQISQHAPFDVFLAANIGHPQLLWQHIHEQRDLGLDALNVYAKGRLVFYSNLPLAPNLSLQDILKDKRYLRLSIANPHLAPYGAAAKQTLECLDMYKQWQPKLIFGQNIAQTFQFIDSKSVDGGFVAMSQVLNKDASHMRKIDETCYDDINQMALRLNNKTASVAFMHFLQSKTARDIIQQNGYRLP
jgi:molybdate transport system substrate-binding protein